MTERQAWAKLADGVRSGRYTNGLCPALFLKRTDFPLGQAVKDRMRAQISRLPNQVDGLWKWTRDAAGQAARARFCDRQVARLTRRKPAKRKPAARRRRAR